MRPASFAVLQAIGSLFVKMLLMHAYASLFMLLSQGNCREAFCAELKRRADRVRRFLKPRPPVRLIRVEPGDICAFCHDELTKPPPTDDEPSQTLDEMYAAQRARAEEEGRLAAIVLRVGFLVAVTLRRGFTSMKAFCVAACERGAVVAAAAAKAAKAAATVVLAAAPGFGKAAGGVVISGSGDSSASGDSGSSGSASRDPSAANAEAPGSSSQPPDEVSSCPHVIHCRWGCGKAVHKACAAAWGRNACVYCSAPMY